MTYREQMHRVATSVETLLADGAKTPGDDVRAALVGHASLVELLTTVHHDLAPDRQPAVMPVEALEHDPVGVLGRMLERQPRVLDQPLTSVVQAEAVSAAGATWRELAVAATLAQHDWQNSIALTRPQGDGRWSELADVASLAQAVPVLDVDIADSLGAVGRVRDASIFREASRSGLRIAAREAHEQLLTRPRPPVADLEPRQPRTVLPVREPVHLEAALRRLGHLAATAEGMTPQHVSLACRGLAGVADYAATSLNAVGQAGAAGEYVLLRDRLAGIAASTHRIGSLPPYDGAPLNQAQQIHLFMSTLRQRRQLLTPSEIEGVGKGLRSAVIGLSQMADRQVERGNWLIRRERGRHEWGIVRGIREVPPVVSRLRAAGQVYVVPMEVPAMTGARRSPAPRRSG